MFSENFFKLNRCRTDIDIREGKVKKYQLHRICFFLVLQKEIEDAKRRGEEMNGTEMRERRTLSRSMTKLMLEVTSDYYESQLQYKEKVKSKIQRQLELADQGFTAEEIERMYEANMNVYSQVRQLRNVTLEF